MAVDASTINHSAPEWQTPVLPSRLDCERELVAQLQMKANSATAEVISLGLSPSEFYNRHLGRIFQAQLAVYERGELVASVPAVHDQLRREDCLLEVLPEFTLLDAGVSELRYLVGEIKKTARLRCARRQLEYLTQLFDDGEFDECAALAEHVARIRDDLIEGVSRTGIDLFTTAAELSADPIIENDWILPGYLIAGAVTELIARIKEGKTTFALAFVKAAITGGMFLGYRIPKQKVVYLTEQPRLSFLAQLRREGITDTPAASDLHILFHSEVRHLRLSQVIKLAIGQCKRQGANVLAIDSFGVFAGFVGSEENDSGHGQTAVSELVWAATQGIAVLSLRHAVKGTGRDAQDAGRGSGAVSGGADIIIHLKRLEGNQDTTVRELAATGRFAETPDRVVIQFNRDDGEFNLLGDVKRVKHDQTKREVLSLLPRSEEDALIIEEIVSRSGASKGTVQKVLDGLRQDGTSQRIGAGKRNDPYRYFLSVTTGGVFDRK